MDCSTGYFICIHYANLFYGNFHEVFSGKRELNPHINFYSPIKILMQLKLTTYVHATNYSSSFLNYTLALQNKHMLGSYERR